MIDYDCDFNVVIRQIKAVYKEHQHDMVWSLQDYITVFQCFYADYYHCMGFPHSFLTKAQIYKVMMSLPHVEEDDCGYREWDLEPGDYTEVLIPAYFNTEFQYGCNYSILHFISGRIRANRLYENGFV